MARRISGDRTSEDVLRRYYEKLNREKNKKPVEEIREEPKVVVASSIDEAEKYIRLEGRKIGSYDRPDLLISMDKYHPSKNWDEAHEELKKEDGFMLNMRDFADFLNLLRSGKAYDGKGDKIDKARLNEILNDITEVRTPWRAEWIDHLYADKGKTTSVTYHIADNGSLKEVTEPLEDCLRDDRTPGIDLEDWLDDANNQGLPPKKVKKGGLYYWHPRNGAVARFGSNSDRAGLLCCRDRQYSDADLRVRRAKILR